MQPTHLILEIISREVSWLKTCLILKLFIRFRRVTSHFSVLTTHGTDHSSFLVSTIHKKKAVGFSKSRNPKACNEFGNKSSRFFQIQKTTSLVAASYHNLAVVLMVRPVASSPENPFKDTAFLNINDNPPQKLKSIRNMGGNHPTIRGMGQELRMEYVADDAVQHFSLGLFEKLLCPLQTADMWQESELN
jgi:hypothetical protein